MFDGVITHVVFFAFLHFFARKNKKKSVLHQTHIVAVSIVNAFTIENADTEFALLKVIAIFSKQK
jgi:hypothetical protein